MNKEATIKTLLENIRLSQGDAFDYDEIAILKEYEKGENNQSSIAIKILSIFGGFLATVTFVGFLALIGFYESTTATFVLGVGFIIAAIVLNKIYAKLIIDTFSISIYIVGFLSFAFALTEMFVNQNIIAVLVIVIASVCLVITQNYLLSFTSLLMISASLLTLILSNNNYDLIHLYVGIMVISMAYWFLNEAKIITFHNKLSRLYDPIRIGLMVSVLFGLMIIGNRNLVPAAQNLIWLSSLIIIPTGMYLIHIITKINNIESQKSKTLIYALSLLIFLSTVLSPSISGVILILLLSFLVNYKTGSVIGIVALTYFIGQYYYDLNFTLLTKSIILFLSGVMFLTFYLFINKKNNRK
jgi:hypothetical protein